MRKFLSLLLTLALLLSLCPTAFADMPELDYPVLPDGLPEDHRPAMPGLVPESLPVLADDELFSAGIGEFDRYGTLEVSVSQSGDYLAGVTWTAVCSNGSGDYQYDFLVVRPTVVDGETINYLIASQKNQSNSFTYAFNESGNYELWVEVSDLQKALSEIIAEGWRFELALEKTLGRIDVMEAERLGMGGQTQQFAYPNVCR